MPNGNSKDSRTENRTRAEAARENGKKSHGPNTPEGKARSSLNGFKHGLRSGRVVIPGESLDVYNTLLHSYNMRYQPRDQNEADLVTELFNARWRTRRCQSLEPGLYTATLAGMEAEIHRNFPNPSHNVLQALVYERMHTRSRFLEENRRAESRFHREYERAFRLLNALLAQQLREPVVPQELGDLESGLPGNDGAPVPETPAGLTPQAADDPSVAEISTTEPKTVSAAAPPKSLTHAAGYAVTLLILFSCFLSGVDSRLLAARLSTTLFTKIEAGLDPSLSMVRKRFIWKFRERELALGDRTLLIAVLNVTPDSFSDGGNYSEPDRAYVRAMELEELGADILDIGAESTRPGSTRISEAEELRRLIPVLKRLRGHISIPVSVDTYKSAVAEKALELGAEIINDPSALTFDAQLARTVSHHNGGLILNHMRGTPESWAKLPSLKDPMGTVVNDLTACVHRATHANVERNHIALDPGLGFGKRKEENTEIIARLPLLARLDLPILIGASRKSFLQQTTDAETSFAGAAAVTAAILGGAHMIRVHDLKEMAAAARIADAVLRGYPVSN